MSEDSLSAGPSENSRTAGGYYYTPIIEISGGFKHYSFHNNWRLILRKFNLKAFPHELYVLLGPTGCGKSVTVHVILGMIKLNQGTIQVFDSTPKHRLQRIVGRRIGYTPQSLGLYPNFTVSETLRYFGHLLGLSSDYINDRIAFLCDLLELPSDHVQVKHQPENLKRQISFAVALLHQPELLILDDPTSGIDPILRKSMWNHLHYLVKKERCTVLVTTDNCLDAQEADRLGVMKNGSMIMEGPPRVLMTKLHTTTIEDVYTKIYKLTVLVKTEKPAALMGVRFNAMPEMASEGFIFVETAPDVQYPTLVRPARGSNQCLKKMLRWCRRSLCHCCPGPRRIGTLIWREFVRCYRSYLWLLLFILLPVVFLAVLCFTIGVKPHHLDVALINHDVSGSECRKVNNKRTSFISCQILNEINSTIINLILYKDEEAAIVALKKIQVYGVLIFEVNFSNHFWIWFNQSFDHAKINQSYPLPVIEAPSLKLTVDASDQYVTTNVARRIYSEITRSYWTVLGYQLSLDILQGLTTLVDLNILHGDLDPEYIAYYVVPGVVIILMYHMAAIASACTIIEDRINHLYQRDYLAGVKMEELVFSYLLIYGSIVLFMGVLMFLVGVFVFKAPFLGPVYCVIPFVLVQIWAGLRFGIFLSSVLSGTINAVCCIILCLIGALLLEGILWSIKGMPNWLQIIIKLLPQTQTIRAVKTLMWRGTCFTYLFESLGVIVPFCWTVLFIVLTYIFNKY